MSSPREVPVSKAFVRPCPKCGVLVDTDDGEGRELCPRCQERPTEPERKRD